MNIDISSYIKDTEANIMQLDRSTDGLFAFATDTGRIYMSESGHWVRFTPGDISSETDYTEAGVKFTAPVLACLDFTDPSTMYTSTNVRLSDINTDNVQVNRIEGLHGSVYTPRQDTFSAQPVLKRNLFNGAPGLSLPPGSFLQDGNNLKTYKNRFTVMIVMRLQPSYTNGLNPSSNELILPGIEKSGLFCSYNVTSNREGNTASIACTVSQQSQTQLRVRCAGGGNSFSKDYYYNTGKYNALQATGVDIARGDPFILTYTCEGSNIDATDSKLMFSLGGNTWYDKSNSVRKAPTLTGLWLGRNHFNDGTITYGGIDLGYCLMLNDCLGASQLNSVGNMLATKFGTTWENFK